MSATPPAEGRAFVIGVTGNIACGKTTVMTELKRLGAATIDADQVYHQLIAPKSELWKTIVDSFGSDIVAADGQIDRRTLGGLVFREPGRLAELERLTHPAIRSEILRQIGNQDSGVLAVDAVKLIEGGLHQECDSVWLVTCRPDQQVARLIARNELAVEEAEQRVAAQPPTGPKLEVADIHIDNSGELDSTLAQVSRAWHELGLERNVQQNQHAGSITPHPDPVSN